MNWTVFNEYQLIGNCNVTPRIAYLSLILLIRWLLYGYCSLSWFSLRMRNRFSRFNWLLMSIFLRSAASSDWCGFDGTKSANGFRRRDDVAGRYSTTVDRNTRNQKLISSLSVFLRRFSANQNLRIYLDIVLRFVQQAQRCMSVCLRTKRY